MNIWHDISAHRIQPRDFYAVIEITKGGKNKYELDKETGMLVLDRILYTATHYPANYGFIPRTYSEDGDPLDVLVLSSEPIQTSALVRCAPIGVLSMTDEGFEDYKVIAVPMHDPMYNMYTSVKELPKHVFEEMMHFFSVYKSLEGKVTAINEVSDADEAVRIIQTDMDNYRQKLGNGDFDEARRMR